MKTSPFSRRGFLMGAATLAATRLNAVGYTDQHSAAYQPAANEDTSPQAGAIPPYAYVGCYTGGSNARGISVFHYDVTTNELTLAGIVAPVTSPSFIVLDAEAPVPAASRCRWCWNNGRAVGGFAIEATAWAICGDTYR